MDRSDLLNLLQTNAWLLDESVVEEFGRWPAGIDCFRVKGMRVEAARPEPRTSAARGLSQARPNTVIEFVSEPLALEFALKAGEVFGKPVYGLAA